MKRSLMAVISFLLLVAGVMAIDVILGRFGQMTFSGDGTNAVAAFGGAGTTSYAVRFDGQNYIESAGSSGLLSGGPFSVEIFVRQATNNSAHAPIFRAYLEDEEEGYYGWQLRFETGGASLRLDWYDGEQQNVGFDVGLSSFPRAAWVHVAICWDTENVYCFTNGVLVKTVGVTSISCGEVTAYSGSGEFDFGGAMISSGCKWITGFTPPTQLVADDDTLYLWPCTEGTGTSVGETKTNLSMSFNGDPLPAWVTR